jgi:hypothetical protein
MALIECPECGHQVSDQAASCPNCGYPTAGLSTIPADGLQASGVSAAPSGVIEFRGRGRFSHEPAWRPVTVRWLPDKSSMAISDGQRSMLGATRVDELDIAGDGLGTYEILRLRGNMKPIQFVPDADLDFQRVVPTVRATAPLGGDATITSSAPATRANPPQYVGAGYTRTAAGFLFANAVAFALSAVLYVAAGDEYAAYLEDPLQPVEDISTAAAADGVYGLAGLGLLVTGVLFLVWFNQAYKAVAWRGAARTRWSSGWAVGGWFIPFANFVIPKLVMNEVDRISSPGNGPPPIGEDWMTQPRLTTSDLWWTSWILAAIATVVESLMTSVGTVDSVVLWAAVGAGLYAAAGGLLGSVVLTIGGRLSDPSLR